MVKNENTNFDAQITINVRCLRRPCKGGCLYGFEYEGAQPEHRAVARTQSRPRTAQSRHPLPHDTPHTMAVPAREGQTAAARAMAQEAAASLRTTAVESKMGIELGPDMLYGMRLVLLKLGDGALSQFGQKVLSALPLAYAACAIKEHSQMSSAERNNQMTKSLMSFAIPNFIVLVKAAAAQLDLPTPFDMEKKLYLTTLGTGVCTTYPLILHWKSIVIWWF